MKEITKAYEILKLKKDASLAEVNSKYKILLDEYDPEKQPDELKDFFRNERESVINSYQKIIEHLSKINIDNRKKNNKIQEKKSHENDDKILNEDFKGEQSVKEKIEIKSNNFKSFVTNQDILSSAWDSLSGYWGLAIGFSFIYGIITGFAVQLFYIPILIIGGPLSLGYSIFTINLVRKKNPQIGDMFEGFNFFKKALGLYFLYALIVIGGFILLIIPGIYWGLMYSQIYFILADNPNITVKEAFQKSKEIMDGSKLKLFLLQLLYLVLTILSILTLFIGLIAIIPWVRVTNAKFYEYLINNSKVK
tara:strand:- start:826 stop:1746 length:921 start_codon:yes stop_codon:yes gene_type:complete